MSVRPIKVDGRRLRSERTKQLIIEAYLVLAQDLSPRVPTAAEIAAKAGYSVRSIFERFPDILALQVAAVDYCFAQVSALAPPRGVEGNRESRIESYVQTRGQTCERWVRLWRSLVVNQGDSPELKVRIRLARERVTQRMELMFAPEFAMMQPEERRQTLIVLEALTDVESWERMREFFGLSVNEAYGVWIRTIDRLLPKSSSEAV
ncbi:TetR/AcrR family transcriptional regulator [Reyranella sp.]|uniref:TetR/AcrR family transcriptional regulator n=1 Tax=Reyranella sp. TaxID=1929291 RepID=UPI0040364CE2